MEQKKNSKPQLPNPKQFKPKFNFYWIYLAIAVFFAASIFCDGGKTFYEVPYLKVEEGLRNG